MHLLDILLFSIQTVLYMYFVPVSQYPHGINVVTKGKDSCLKCYQT